MIPDVSIGSQADLLSINDPFNILVVDVDSESRIPLVLKLQQWGYGVYEAEDDIAAWTILQSNPIQMVISDWMMPEFDGMAFCRKIRDEITFPYIYIILVSAPDSKPAIVNGLQAGIDDFLVKPIEFDHLQFRLSIGKRMLHLEKNLLFRNELIQKNYFQTIRMVIHLMEAFNEELGGHCRRVGQLARTIGQMHSDVHEADLSELEAAGFIHDIGMIGLPKEIVGKRETEMTGEEKNLYRAHPVQGELILSEIEVLKPIAKLIRHHHEQINGKGFPDGLTGEDIPILARIISAASIYDSLCNKRKVSLDDIPEHLMMLRGYRIEARLVDMLLEINRQRIIRDQNASVMEISIDELKEGMVLADHIRRPNGALVLSKDTRLSAFTIETLKRFFALSAIDGSVFVYRLLP